MEVSSSSSGDGGSNYHVFISVSQADPQDKNLTDMMHRALGMRGLSSFIDENQLIRKQTAVGGPLIGNELREIIRSSTISVIFISKGYLSSSWCLEELVTILDCRKENGSIVVPIFYGIDPSDLRKQRGFASQEMVVGIDSIGRYWKRRWSAARQEAANLCGWDHQGANVILSKVVGDTVRDIEDKSIPTNLNNISVYPLRYDTCDVYLKLFLQMGFDNVLMVGVCGKSQMGKTVIAQGVYNQIFYTFDGSCFLANVGEKSKQHNGMVHLQEKLLRDILFDKDIEIANATIGREMIKEKLSSKRVLVVLDNIDDLEQLFALAGSRNFFGFGSKIIITTRKLYLLRMFGVDQIFMAHGLPPPANLKVIWEEYQHGRRQIVGLKAYMQNLNQLTQTNDKVRYLEDFLHSERRKNAMQAQVISKVKVVKTGEDLPALTA